MHGKRTTPTIVQLFSATGASGRESADQTAQGSDIGDLTLGSQALKALINLLESSTLLMRSCDYV